MDELEDIAEGLPDLDDDHDRAPPPPAAPTREVSLGRLQLEIERALASEEVRDLIRASIQRQLGPLLDSILSRPSFRRIVRGEITKILASHTLSTTERHR